MNVSTLRDQLAEATRPFPWRAAVSGDILTSGREWIVASVNGQDPYGSGGLSIVEDDANAALIVAAVNALPALLDMAEAARDLYSLAVGEHGHDETHSADWPSCLPAHIAMNRYRDALGRLDALP